MTSTTTICDAATHFINTERMKMESAKAAMPECLSSALPTVEDVEAGIILKGKLRASKPKAQKGSIRYAWRMARFHSGADMTMPTTATFDTMEWMKENGYGHNSGEYTSIGPVASAVWAYLDSVAVLVLTKAGINPTRATIRWGRALGMI